MKYKKIIKKLSTAGLVLSWLLTGWPGLWFIPEFPSEIKEIKAITCEFGSEIGSTGVCQGFLTTTGSNQTWTSPSDWNNNNNTIECIGAGGSGGAVRGSTTDVATGGGGGAYSLISDFYVANPGTTQATYRIGAGGTAITQSTTGSSGGNTGEDSWFNNSTFPGSGTDNSYCGAKGGSAGAAGAATQSGGAGGVGTSGYGETRRSGGAGGSASHSSNATGGGGTAGNSSTGGNGVSSSTTNSQTNGGQANGSGASGGTAGSPTGGNGNDDTEYTTYGSGGGGGGGRTSSNNTIATGGSGGSRGAGGAGAITTSVSGANAIAISGAGGNGIIVITYTPTSSGSTISGTIYQTNESSAYDCSSGGPYTVYLRVNGSGTYSTTCTASSGAWSVSDVSVSSGQTIYAYIYGETPKGSTVLVSDGTTQTNVPIYVDRVTLRDDVNGTITNSEISTGNTSDSDDLISFSGSDITVASSYEMHIYTGDTYAPGANVSTGKLHVVGSYSGSTETLTLTGSGTSTSRPLYVNGGTFTAPSTTVFQGTSATDIESTTFNALSFTPTITSGIIYTFLGAETINGNFTINPTASSTYALTVNLGGTTTVGSGYTTTISGTTSGVSTLDTVSGSNHSFSTGILNVATAGTLTANNSTISLTGTSGTLFTRVGTFTSGGSTVSATSTSGTPTLNSGTISFYNLTIDPSSLTVSTASDNITVTNTLNVATGDTLSLVSGQNLTHSGATLILNGTISGSGTYVYTGSGTLPTGGTLSSNIRFDATNNNQTISDRTYSGNEKRLGVKQKSYGVYFNRFFYRMTKMLE